MLVLQGLRHTLDQILEALRLQLLRWLMQHDLSPIREDSVGGLFLKNGARRMREQRTHYLSEVDLSELGGLLLIGVE